MATKLPSVMKAVGLYKYLPISDVNSLVDLQVSLPSPKKNEVLVEVKATAVNPIDTKLRAPKPDIETTPRILGLDGAGVVVAKGENAGTYKVGDEVFFVGDMRSKSGTNAQYVALEEILIAPKPKRFTFEQAAAMPLTAYTAYEAIHDRLLITEKDAGKSILVINSAGGVGSIATQLLKNLGLKVIGTASRPESEEFTRKYGAEIVLNHSKDLVSQLKAIGYGSGVDYILLNYDPVPYWDQLPNLMKAQGRMCLLTDAATPVDIRVLRDKSISMVSMTMYTRLKYNTDDRNRYTQILSTVSKLIDDGKLDCTLTKVMTPIDAANLREAHRIIEEKKMLGKLVLSGF
ncbi:hypothetical protein ABMA28_014808 [Loxostege sticticalis]|uniref:Enoyl reductase (ER) domain-containing protein n=1 Tax=Loxostege sticticalis TaxID=481309 RepID=A0ABD0TCG6_LOXSC